MAKVKVYICSSFPRRKEAQMLALKLSPIMEIVSTWHRDDLTVAPRVPNNPEILQRTMRDFTQLRRSQLVIVFIGDNLSGGGRHTELGLALGMRKDIMLIGLYDPNPFELIPYLRHYDTAEGLVDELKVLRESIEADFKWRDEQAELNKAANETE